MLDIFDMDVIGQPMIRQETFDAPSDADVCEDGGLENNAEGKFQMESRDLYPLDTPYHKMVY